MTMRSVVVTEQGPPEVLQVAEVDLPVVKGGEALVRVHGAAVNPSDTLLRSGAVPIPPKLCPFVVGMDLAGTVEQVAPGTDTEIVVGDRVMSMTIPIAQGGAYSEYVAVPARWLVAVPEGISLHEAATLPMNALTAMQAIQVTGLERDDVVAVTGAAGTFGTYFLQLAKTLGIRTIADAAPADADAVRSAGAFQVVRRGSGFVDDVLELVPQGVSAVVDAALVGPSVLGAVADGGIYAGLRGVSGPGTIPLPDATRGVRYLDFDVAGCAGDPRMSADLRSAAAQGVLTPRIADVLPPEAASKAHSAMEAGGVRGRFVLDFAP